LATVSAASDDLSDRTKKKGPESLPPSPGSPRVDAFDAAVVARVRHGGRVPCGRAREWTIYG